MSNASDFFSGGGSSAGISADGMPPIPAAASGFIDFTASVRNIVIGGTTDSIRVPYGTEDTGVNTLGYRRVDKASGGASEWLIDWNAIASFTGGTLNLLDDGVYSGNCHITDTKLYFGFQDVLEGITNRHYSYLVKADLVTGAIESVTPITAAPTTVTYSNSSSGTSRETTFNGDTATAPFWWEIDDTEQLIVYYNATTSSESNKGIARVVYSSDLTTVIEEEILFDTSQAVAQSFQYVDYVSEDGEIIVAHNSTNILIGISSTLQVVSLDHDLFLTGIGNVVSRLSSSFRSSSGFRQFNCLTQGAIAIARECTTVTGNAVSNSNNNIVRPFITREDLDKFLKEVVFQISGVLIV